MLHNYKLSWLPGAMSSHGWKFFFKLKTIEVKVNERSGSGIALE